MTQGEAEECVPRTEDAIEVGETGNDSGVFSRGSTWIVAAATAVSLVLPLSYDETFWLAIARMVQSGRSLYETALDNKSPLVYLGTWLLDVAPGPVNVAAALAFGTLLAWTSSNLRRILRSPGPRTDTVVALATTVVALQAGFALTTELAALALLSAAIRRNGVGALIMLVGSAGIDPRSVLLFPGVLLTRFDRGDRSRAYFRIAVAVVTVFGIGVVLATPRLRYGLVELNLGSRTVASLIPASDYVISHAAAALPWALLGSFGRWPSRSGLWLLIAGAALVPLISGLPYPHYWIFFALPVVVVLRGQQVDTGRVRRLGVLMLAPLLVTTTLFLAERRQEASHQAHIVAALERYRSPSFSYTVIGPEPDVAAEIPESTNLLAPTLSYLTYETTRSNSHRQHFERALSASDALVDDRGLLDAERDMLTGSVLELYDSLTSVVGNFACQVEVDGSTIYLKPHLCN